MALLIDGYNLLHVTAFFGEGRGQGTFQHAREALLRFLAASLTENERTNTTVVFDAAGAPPGLPSSIRVEDISVRYAAGYPDADSLIEELIQSENAPRSLLVVSSDHRIQRAARRRRAKAIDSDRWYSELWQRRVTSRSTQQMAFPEKPLGELSPAEIAYWVSAFSTPDVKEKSASPEWGGPSQSPTDIQDSDNPFPPGYGEDLLRDDEAL